MKSLSKLLILLLIAKIIGVALWWYLPSEGVELQNQKSYQAKYQRVDFKNMLVRAKIVKQEQQKSASVASPTISSLILKGLYGTKSQGFAIVAQKRVPNKTTIVSIGESYAGYRLKEIRLKQVVFSKNGKEYILAMDAKKKPSTSRIQRVTKERKIDDGIYRVTRSDIAYYSHNPAKIWKDIAIDPLKKDGKITGFKIFRVRPNSQFDKIGLKKGDVIIKANNVKLTSLKAVFDIYKNINNISTVDLVVLRNNQEKEILYEIH